MLYALPVAMNKCDSTSEKLVKPSSYPYQFRFKKEHISDHVVIWYKQARISWGSHKPPKTDVQNDCTWRTHRSVDALSEAVTDDRLNH
jgi:hypothetical protein